MKFDLTSFNHQLLDISERHTHVHKYTHAHPVHTHAHIRKYNPTHTNENDGFPIS